MLKCLKLIFISAAICTLSVPASSYANDFLAIADHEPKSELWLNPGMLSYHFDRERSFNSRNVGFGAEYRYSTVASVTLGTYRNSYHESSNYIGAYWQPIQFGSL
jgi:hypothetical protein